MERNTCYLNLSVAEAARTVSELVERAGLSSRMVDCHELRQGENLCGMVLLFEKYFLRMGSRLTLTAVLDNLERGVSQFEEGDAHRQGLELICKQFEEVLTKLNVAEIPALGEKFDPEKHNAVMHTEDETAAENTVVEVFQKGYTLGDKILRFAMVKVAN